MPMRRIITCTCRNRTSIAASGVSCLQYVLASCLLFFSMFAIGQDLDAAVGQYAWLQDPRDGATPPPLNIVLDCSRGEIGVARGWAKDNLFSTNVTARMQFRVCPLELSVAALDNANVLVVPLCSGNAFPEYDKSEMRIMSGFVERGGLLVVSIGAGSFANEKFLGDYGVKFEEVYREKIGAVKCAPIALRGFDIELSEDWTKESFMRFADNSEWIPIFTASNEDGEDCALVAVKKTGKGYILACHRAVVRNKMNNKLFANLIDALARQIRRIDPVMPFEDIPITSGSCRRAHGIPIYYGERFAKEANFLQDELNRFIPELEKEWGVLFCIPTNLAYRAIGRTGISGCCWSSIRHDIEASRRIYPVGVLCDSPLEGMFTRCHFAFLIHAYTKPRFNRLTMSRVVDGPLWAILACRALSRSGHKAFAGRNELKHDAMYRAFSKLVDEEPTAMNELFKVYLRHEDSRDFVAPVDEHQLAYMFAEAMYSLGKDTNEHMGNPNIANGKVFALFNECGVRARLDKVKFEKSPVKVAGVLPWVWANGKEVPPNAFRLGQSSEVLEFAGCRTGRFEMGCRDSDDKKKDPLRLHVVAITKPFWITKTQITKGQYFSVMGDDRWKDYTELEKLLGAEKSAADGITLADAETFCRKLTTRYGNRLPAGYEFRLPTEAEWEYALWGGERRRDWLPELAAATAQPYFRLPEEDAMLLEQAGYTLAKDEQMPMGPVGTKQPNALGVYDMLGNGWELLADRFAAPKDGAPVSDPLVMGEMLGYEEMETNAVRGVGLESGYGLARGGEFLPGHGFCKRMFSLDATEMPRDTTFRIVIGPKLDKGKEEK